MMPYVLTVMSDPAKYRLTQAEVEAFGGHTEWLSKDEACDIFLLSPPSTLRLPPSTDYILQSAPHRLKKLLIADMESTLIRNEFLDELAEFVGKREEVSTITRRAMNGELDFAAALNARVALLEGLPDTVLEEVWQRVEYMPGAHQLITVMRAQGAYCMLVSGGFDVFAKRVADALGFHEYRANRLEITNNVLTGHVIPPVLGKEAKQAALEETIVARGITREETLAVGDGANDLPMLLAAGLGIAYHAKPAVQAVAQHHINHCDLRALLWAQGLHS